MIVHILQKRLEIISSYEERLDKEIERIKEAKREIIDNTINEVLVYEEIVLSNIDFLNQYRKELNGFISDDKINSSFDVYQKKFRTWDIDFLTLLKEIDEKGEEFDNIEFHQ